jgi:hypothetical protein
VVAILYSRLDVSPSGQVPTKVGVWLLYEVDRRFRWRGRGAPVLPWHLDRNPARNLGTRAARDRHHDTTTSRPIAMAINANAASVAPLSPAASPRSSPLPFSVLSRNLKVDNGTQPAHDNIQPLSEQALDALGEKYNRRSTPLMSCKEFRCLVTSVVRELEGSAAKYNQLEAALEERVNNDTQELKTQLEQVKRYIFLAEDVPDELDDLLPFVQQETHRGWLQYIIRTLPKLRQLYSAQQPATAEPPLMPTPPPVPTRPRPQKQRATGIPKTSKQERAAPVRRSDRIKELANKAPIHPRPHAQRATGIQKTRKSGRAALRRRSDGIKKLTNKRA